MRAAKEAGELLHTADAMQAWSGVINLFKTRLASIPRKTAPLILGVEKVTEIQGVLEDEINSVLFELSEPDLKAIAKKAFGESAKIPKMPKRGRTVKSN